MAIRSKPRPIPYWPTLLGALFMPERRRWEARAAEALGFMVRALDQGDWNGAEIWAHATRYARNGGRAP